jgi:hypothetical protein
MRTSNSLNSCTGFSLVGFIILYLVVLYLIRPIENKNDFILYILSTKETKVVLKEVERLDLSLISNDYGIISYENDPFLLSQISDN